MDRDGAVKAKCYFSYLQHEYTRTSVEYDECLLMLIIIWSRFFTGIHDN